MQQLEEFSPKELVERFQTDRLPPEWGVEPELEGFNDLPEVKYRNHFVRKKLSEGLNKLLAIYIKITLDDLRDMLGRVLGRVLDEPLTGYGLELGAGTAAVSANLCKIQPGIDGMLAVELCDEFVKTVMPVVSGAVLGNDASRVVPIVGSFNNLPLAEGSVDFIIEMGSFHHSSDLASTFNNSYRVLKPGGLLLCFDRCHPDTLTDAEVEKMLNVSYGEDFYCTHGYPEGISVTRRENGEHEYRLREWLEASGAAGFVNERLFNLRKIPLKRALRGLLSVVPEGLRKRLFMTRDADMSIFVAWLRNSLGFPPKGDGLDKIHLAQKDLTVMIFRKPA